MISNELEEPSSYKDAMSKEGGKGVWNHPKRQSKGGRVMIWGPITAKGEYLLLWLQGKINSSKYLSMITEDVYPWILNHCPEGGYFFLQDNAPIHNSKLTMEGLKNLEMRVLHSPDINPIKNLSDKVYAKGAYNSDDEL
ncbi:hypothetical protein ILUMI_16403 [Ignelater luminosus]|uniref:Transposase n=1 Tax=Ignelater luminosus TaxID=2038154 RepID=A0A8K0G2X8_IGNLU|nr:hypothetical protein ILUMI_16403 [Ignelater luminosus]